MICYDEGSCFKKGKKMDNINTNTGVNMNNVAPSGASGSRTVKKAGKKYIPVMVILAVLAVAGMGFGIFGMVMNGQSQQKADDLGVQLEEKQELLAQVQEKLGVEVEPEVKEEGETEELVESVNVAAARDYIYIGEWGVKIKVPESLAAVSYVFGGGKTSLRIAASTAEGQYTPHFVIDSIADGSGLVQLHRYNKREAEPDSIKVGEWAKKAGACEDFTCGLGEVVYIEENGDYFFTLTQQQMDHGGEEQQWERNSVEELVEMVKTGVSAF